MKCIDMFQNWTRARNYFISIYQGWSSDISNLSLPKGHRFWYYRFWIYEISDISNKENLRMAILNLRTYWNTYIHMNFIWHEHILNRIFTLQKLLMFSRWIKIFMCIACTNHVKIWRIRRNWFPLLYILTLFLSWNLFII